MPIRRLSPLDHTNKVPVEKLGDGIADETKFLRGDRTWSSISVDADKLIVAEITIGRIGKFVLPLICIDNNGNPIMAI